MHWGAYVVGICEPKDPGGHGAWGMDFTQDGAEHRQYGGYLGRKESMSSTYAAIFGMVQAARILKKVSAETEELTISTTSTYVLKMLNGEEEPKDENIPPLIKRFKNIIHGRKVVVGHIGKDFAEKADSEARRTIWEAIHQWPVHGGMMKEPPNVPKPAKVAIKKTTLDMFGGDA